MKLILVILIAALVAAAADTQAGRAGFEKNCRLCHGPQGAGNPAIAKALNAAIPDLGSKEGQSKSDEEIKAVITQGKGKMKPVRAISNAEVKDVIAFVRSLAKK